MATYDVEVSSAKQYKASRFDIWALGITIVIGGQYFSWNVGLAAGVWSMFVSIAVTATSYICLALCLAETVSGLPFAGGAYGLSRCSLGFFGGYMVGCCEALQYILYTASSVLVLGDMVLELVDLAPDDVLWYVRPLTWVTIYAVVHGLQRRSQRRFWICNMLLALVSVGIVLVYVIVSLPHASYDLYGGGEEHSFKGGMRAFMEHLPLSAWFFVGIESLNTVANMVDEPKRIIPAGQTACVFTLVASAVSVYLVAVCMPPGIDSLQADLIVIRGGFVAAFGAGPYVATVLSLPATFATIYGFIFLYSNVLASMAASKLLPLQFAHQHPAHKTFPTAALGGSSVGLGLCFVGHYCPNIRLYNICMVFGFSANIAQVWNYMFVRTKFKHLSWSFRSPLGMFGAVVAMAVSALQLVALLVFQPMDGSTAFVVGGVFVVLTLAYVGYIRDTQTLSSDEHRVLFFAHISKSSSRVVCRRTTLMLVA
ncbi:hypothetical protein, variant [Aphanomyces invadans]|uniref:Amino acid permease/ SLC12A domain-containing protein n=1 Tax=Aphanomyces invadans TaxID=157072 RepID=A0A024TZ92_9STRA|nr:hypothetical protein, variant [Aphanomyces invadans]ETV99470.1 hypothetical protein, variant [Aphanomyces invadans]|eukprot:XP_008872026.1 hypothetical protein, variant [Aphanomyces invadans]